MGFAHINNLERDQRILEFKHVYALEKLHGTSARIDWKDIEPFDGERIKYELSFFSGGEKYEKFVALFDTISLTEKFEEKFGTREVTIYGEAYGGSQQGMSATYGPNLKFGVFRVKIDSFWLDVPKAHDVALSLGLEFVDYKLVPTTMEALLAERDADSVQAIRNGMGPGKMREGIVLNPPFEVTLNNGEILTAKFKRPEFSERRSTPKVLDADRAVLIQNAQTVAFDWVTMERTRHVVDQIISQRNDKEVSLKDTSTFIRLMQEDILREGSDEIFDTREIRKAIGTEAVKNFKAYLGERLRENVALRG